MKKFSTALFYYHQRLIKRCRQNPKRYFRVDEGIWKDAKQNFDDIQVSMKDDKKL